MVIEISKIKVTNRIRKEVLHIDELAENIRQNGFITPIAVMELGNGEYQLLAGLRRLKAMISLKKTEIKANVFPASTAETALKIEFSENEQREPFTYSEKMDYARLIEEIEKAKAQERMYLGKSEPILKEGSPPGDYPIKGRVSEIVGQKIGMGKTTYQRAKYIADHATSEQIAQLDSGEKKIKTVFREIKNVEKQHELPKPITITNNSKPIPEKPKTSSQAERLKALDKERIAKVKDFNALKPEEKIAELQKQLSEEKAKSARIQGELDDYRAKQHNQIIHRDSIIDNLKARNTALEMELAVANARIKELEVNKK
jgi:ParB family chromosome partitioning protein